MKQTAVEWLAKEIKTFEEDYGAIIHHKGELEKLLNQAKQMEAKQSKITELSDEEIEKWIDEHIKEWIDSTSYYGHGITEYKEGLEDGIKWYKEQLKQRQ